MKNRFRVLLIRYPEPVNKSASAQIEGAQDTHLYKQGSVIEAARASGWTGERFDSFIKNNTAGSAILYTPDDSISFIAQTPKDDGFPFFAISLTQRPTEAHQHDADWECLVFIRPATFWDDCVEPMLDREPFPHDYLDPLQPDFMVLLVVLLCCQVEQIMEELNEMKRMLIVQDPDLVAKRVEELKEVKTALFALGKENFLLHRRWEFARELAENLTEAFGVIARRYSSEDEIVKYSPTLTARVANQQAIIKSVIYDLDTTGSRVESQQKFVDDQIRAAIAQRNSASMKAIAVVTVIFLPATFLATVFSMGIFNWQAGEAANNPTIVSKWLWLYFVLSVVLTVIVIAVWKIVSKSVERRLMKKSAEKAA